MNLFKVKLFTTSVVLVLLLVFVYHNVIDFNSFYVINKFPRYFKKNRQEITTNINYVVKRIHQSWKDANIPKQFSKFVKSWTEDCYKNWTYKLWTDEDNLNLVKTHYPWLLKTFTSFSRPIYRADISRYIYMHRYGGIYTDLDNECLAPFEDLLTNYSLVFGAMEGQFGGTDLSEGYVQNSFLYSRPGHKFWLELLNAINLDPNSNIPEIRTGPVILSKIIQSFRTRYRNDMSVRVFDPVYFNPITWLVKEKNNIHCKDKGRMSDEDWKICRSHLKAQGSFVAQYHYHFWR